MAIGVDEGRSVDPGIVVWDMFAPWVAEVVGRRKTIVVAMDWTDFDADDETTLALNLVSTTAGRRICCG